MAKRFGMGILIEETGEIFGSMIECAEYLGVGVSSVSQCVSGKTHTCCGYHLKRIEHYHWQPLTDDILGEIIFLSDDDSTWMEHPFRPNVYVSELGTIAKFQNGGVVIKNQYRQNSGYLVVSVENPDTRNSKNSNVLVHRLVAETFLGNHDPERQFVNHKNGDKTDNRAGNLEWCTRSENMRHAFDTGLYDLERVQVLETGEIYKSATECAKAIGGTVSGIHDCKTGRQKQHRGYHFRFMGDGCREKYN